MKLRNLAHLIIMFALFAGCALPPQTGQAEIYYPDPVYSREELAQLLAPVALYPDALLSQVLMAATYPIEVVEADRWLRGNPYLQGEALDFALAGQDWDPSVKSLCHFPSILALMSERIGDTTDLGNAFLAQEDEVMDMIQELRAAAYAQGHLYTTAEQRIIFDGPTIVIAPATPIIYVPYYDPYTVYGPWWYPDYPPYRWAPRGVNIGFGISYWPGIHFSFSFVSWSRFDWHRRQIHIDVHRRPRYVRHDHWVGKSRWQHAPSHRRGVAYHDKFTVPKYRQPSRGIPVRRDVRDAPLHRDRFRPTVNSQTRIDRQRAVKPQTTPPRQTRSRWEKPKTIPEKRLQSRPNPIRRQINETPGRSVRKGPEPQKQPKRHFHTEKQPERTNGDRFMGRNAPQSHRPQQAARKRPGTERQPVAAKHPKRQPTTKAALPSREDRRQRLSNRDQAAAYNDIRKGFHYPKERDRVENPDRGNNSDLQRHRGRTNEGNRFDQTRSGRRERN